MLYYRPIRDTPLGNTMKLRNKRLYDAANVSLNYQSTDGDWATYENNLDFGWFEQLDPSEVFGDIMIDYCYVQCSMASMTGLAMFRDMIRPPL